MNRISPVWILTTLEGEELDRFTKAVDQQFTAFSETELNGGFTLEGHRWWGVGKADKTISKQWDITTGYPNGIPAFACRPGVFDNGQALVIYYAPIFQFMEGAEYIADLKEDARFYRSYGGNRFFYGLVGVRNKDLSQEKGFTKAIEKIEEEKNVFNSITFHGENSHNAGPNPRGYLSLADDDYLSLAVNLIFNMAITKTKMFDVANGQNRVFNTAGLFSFTYEPDAYKKDKAFELSKKLMTEFCNNERDSEWYNENEAKSYFDNSDLKQDLHWNSVYNLMKQGFEEEELRNVYPKSEISPWRMLAYELVPKYFRDYIYNLRRIVSENTHDFSALTVMRYEDFAQKRRTQMLEGTAPIDNKVRFARNCIADYVSTVWSYDNKGAKGVSQVLKLIENTNTYLTEQRNELDSLKDFKDAKEEKYIKFPEPKDYPLDEVHKEKNKEFLKHYDDISKSESKKKYTEQEIAEKEKRSMDTLGEVLQWHPMPLNLFVKAALLSALLPVVILAILTLIPGNLINIFSLDTYLGLGILYAIVACIVIAIALYQYAFKTLHKIKETIRKYVAWIYFRTQQNLYLITLEQEKKYYDDLIKECDSLTKRLKSFKAVKADELVFGKYYQSKFQRNILGTMDDGNPILGATIFNSVLNLNGKKYDVNAGALQPSMFTDMTAHGNRDLGTRMKECVLNQPDSDARKIKNDLLELWTGLMADNIDIVINGNSNNDDIDGPAYYGVGNGITNIVDEAIVSANACMYPSIYVPVAPAYSWTTTIVPARNGKVWEAIFKGSNNGSPNQRIPDFAMSANIGNFLTTSNIAIVMRVHSYSSLLIDSNNANTTIFNNLNF